MNREHWKALLPIITAFVEGKPVQRGYGQDGWRTLNAFSFSTEVENYRIKPEPIVRWAAVFVDEKTGKDNVWSMSSKENAEIVVKSFPTRDKGRVVKLVEET